MNYKFLLVSILLLILIGSAHAKLTDGLVAYYNFDETSGTILVDSKGYDNNLILGTGTLNQNGLIGKAVKPPAYGTNTPPNRGAKDTSLEFTDSFSVNQWVKNNGINNDELSSNSSRDSGYKGWWTAFVNTDKVSFRIANGGAGMACQTDATTSFPNDGMFHMITTVYNRISKRLLVYIDGTLDGNTSCDTTPTYSTFSRFSPNGWQYDALNQWQSGGLYTQDELSVWSKPLNQEEITELYNSGNGITYNQIYADFDYVVTGTQVDLNDTSIVFGDAVIDSWEWLIDDLSVSTDQNYLFTGTELTDYNVCLIIQDTTLSLEDSTCQTVSISDLTPPVTTFSYEQISGTTDTNITLTCTDNNSGCKTINYNINNEGWITPLTNIFSRDTTTYNNYSLEFTKNWEYTDFPITSYKKFNSINVALRTSNASYPAEAKLVYYYTDGTNEDSNTASTYSASFIKVSFSLPNPNKDINKIEYYQRKTSTAAYAPQTNDRNISYDYLTNPYSFLFSGAGDHNIQFYSTDNADNNEPIKTATFSTYGIAKFNLYDENTADMLNDITWSVSPNINGNYGSTLTDTNTFTLNLQGITSGEYTFTFQKTGYGTRYYTTNLTQYSDIDINFALLPSSLSTIIPFKVYQTDETTIFANTFIELFRPDTGFIVGKNKTNTLGETTFNIHISDQNYYANVNEGEYTYQPVALTILYPKNELTLEQITETWRVDITQNLYESFTDLNADKIIYLLPNTALPFNIRIQDMNGNYFARTSAKQYPGNPLTDTLQPYLVPIDTGLLTTITTKSSLTNQIVPNVTIKIYKFISGTGRTLVEEVITDNKGQALVLLELNAEYEFETYLDAEFIKTYTITATSSSIFLMLPVISDFEPTEPSGFKTTFTPINTGLTKINVGNATFTQTINNFGSISYTVTSQIIQNGIVLSTETYSASTLASRTFTRIVPWSDINKGELISRVTITTSQGSFSYQQTYFINDAFGTEYNLFEGLSTGLRSDFGCSANGLCWTLLVLGLIISIVIGIYASSILNNLSGQATAIITILPLTLFAYLTWVPFELVIGIIIIVGAWIINERRG